MAKKEVNLNDFLTKVSNIFKHDMFILDNYYCLGGLKTESNTVTESIVLVNPEIIELFKNIFEDKKNVYLKDVKKTKTDFKGNIDFSIDESILSVIQKRKDKDMKLIKKEKDWKTFNFTEEEIETLFEESSTIELFKDDDEIPNVTISKSIFPMITKTNINKMYYSPIYDKENKLVTLIFGYDTDYFQVYSILRYLVL